MQFRSAIRRLLMLLATSASGLTAIMGFLAAQRSDYLPSKYTIVHLNNGQSAVAVQFDAPGPLGLNGT